MRLEFPVLSVALSLALGSGVATLGYGTGWMVRYTAKLGVSGAIAEFIGRLQDAAGLDLLSLPNRPLRPKHPGASPTPTPGPSATPSPSGAQPSPTPTPGVPHRLRSVREEVHRAVAGMASLPASARTALLAAVDRCAADGLGSPLALLSALALRKDVPPDPAGELTRRVMTISQVAALLKLGPVDAERIAFNWDAGDIVKAYAHGKEKDVALLAAGRPEKFFLDLVTEENAFNACMANLHRLEPPPPSPSPDQGAPGGPSPEGTGPQRPGQTAGPSGAPQGDGAAKVAPPTCPTGGTYTTGPSGLECSIHGSLRAPYARAYTIRHFLGPLAEARHLMALAQLDEAERRLLDLLRQCPRHMPAAGEMARILVEGRDWAQAAPFFRTWAPRMADNVAVCLWAATAFHASGDLAGAAKWSQAAQAANPDALPALVVDRAQFYLLRDRAAVILEMAQKGVRFEDFTMTDDAELPSVRCRQNLGLIRDAINIYAHGYPKTNPIVTRLQEREMPLHTKLKVTADKAARKVIIDQIKIYRAKERELLADTSGKAFVAGLASVLAQTSFAGCPQGGRYSLSRQRWLDCSVHPGVFPDPAFREAQAPASGLQESMLTRALQSGVLQGEPDRKACYVAQKEYLTLSGAAGPAAIASPAPEIAAGGKTFRCPSGGLFTTTDRPGGLRNLSCSVHGSFQTYFAGDAAQERSP